jgi:esterase/lipase
MLNQFAAEFRAALIEYNVTDLNKLRAYWRNRPEHVGEPIRCFSVCLDQLIRTEHSNMLLHAYTSENKAVSVIDSFVYIRTP